MTKVELKSKQARQGDGSNVPRRVAGDPDNVKSRIRVVPILITLGTVAVAAFCVSAWNKDPVFGVIGIQSGPRH